MLVMDLIKDPDVPERTRKASSSPRASKKVKSNERKNALLQKLARDIQDGKQEQEQDEVQEVTAGVKDLALSTLNNQFPKFEPKFLAAKTPHHLDKTIRFHEESHTYYVKWNLTKENEEFSKIETISVSAFVHYYFEPFDADKIISKMMNNKSRFEKSQYCGMTREEIKQKWEDNRIKASTEGNILHFLLECFFNGMSLEAYDNLKTIQQFKTWYETQFLPLGLVPFRTELRMRSDAGLRLTGTSDFTAIKANYPPPSDTDGVLELLYV